MNKKTILIITTIGLVILSSLSAAATTLKKGDDTKSVTAVTKETKEKLLLEEIREKMRKKWEKALENPKNVKHLESCYTDLFKYASEEEKNLEGLDKQKLAIEKVIEHNTYGYEALSEEALLKALKGEELSYEDFEILEKARLEKDTQELNKSKFPEDVAKDIAVKELNKEYNLKLTKEDVTAGAYEIAKDSDDVTKDSFNWIITVQVNDRHYSCYIDPNTGEVFNMYSSSLDDSKLDEYHIPERFKKNFPERYKNGELIDRSNASNE